MERSVIFDNLRTIFGSALIVVAVVAALAWVGSWGGASAPTSEPCPRIPIGDWGLEQQEACYDAYNDVRLGDLLNP